MGRSARQKALWTVRCIFAQNVPPRPRAGPNSWLRIYAILFRSWQSIQGSGREVQMLRARVGDRDAVAAQHGQGRLAPRGVFADDGP